MRYLVTALALVLSACGPGANLPTTQAASVTSSTNSVNSSSSVTSSTSSNVGSSTTSSNVGGTSTTTTNSTRDGTSTCSTEHNGRRCEISCRAPRVAQCDKSPDAVAPSCFCS